jgi:DNA-binding SARP family transcriptional activator/tetratricopeptide (TPR) repeat protein
MAVAFGLLGPLEVVVDGRPVELRGQKRRALLALLLLEANRVVASDRLIEALWEGQPTATAAKALQVYVSQLRRLLGRDRLQTKSPGYLIRVEEGELDLLRFRALRDGGRLREALALWRGPPLAEFTYQPFAQAEVARLEEERLACLEQRIEHDLAQGRRVEQLVGELEGLVREEPLRERLRALLMLALYRSGRQADALETYRRGRDTLVERLGIEPGPHLRELQQAILRQDPSLEVSGTREGTAPARGAFVGRDHELGQLVGGIEDAVGGHGRLFLLVGEPGIGKSRLAEETIRRARTQGLRVLVGRCWEASGAPAYWPWVQALRGYIRDAEPELLRADLGAGAGEVAQILPELQTLLPDLPEPVAPESESARFALFDATAAFLRATSSRTPLLLFLDDLHAADVPSLLLLRFISRELGSTRVVVLGACRDVDPVPGEPLASMLADLGREPVTTRFTLLGLSEDAVAEYVASVAGELASPALAATLYEETEGNPLFLTETVRLLAAEGRIAIPESLREVITRRLSHLSVGTNRLLVLACVLGREFAVDVLARMAGMGDDDLLDVLEEAMDARIVADIPGTADGLRFAHMLIRDTLYDGLSAPRRASLHRLALETLERMSAQESVPRFAELAHHARAGGDFSKALDWARRGGDYTVELLAYEEAARLYRVALEALELALPVDEAAKCELLISLGEAQARAGDSSLAKATSLEAARIARRLGLPHPLARAAAAYGDGNRVVWARAGDDELLVPLLEEGLAAAGDERGLRARLLARLAGALRDEHRRERRDALSREAVELARATEDPVVLGYALVGRAHAITAPDTVAEYLALADELRRVAVRIGDQERILAAHMLRIMGQHVLGEIAAAYTDLDAASAIAHELQQPSHLWEVGGVRAGLALAEGRFDEADALIEAALTVGEQAMPEAARSHHRMQRFILCDFRGGLEAVEPSIAELVAEHPTRPVFVCALAYLQARLGREVDAQPLLDEMARDELAALPFDQEWLLGASLVAEACLLLGDTASAEGVYRKLLPWQAMNAVDQSEGTRGSIARCLGQLATLLERWDDAVGHFEQALALNERMGFRPWLALTQSNFARMLRLRGGPDNRERAAALEETASATCNALEIALPPSPARGAPTSRRSASGRR